MNIQELKKNRKTIIASLTLKVGENNLKKALQILKDQAEFSEKFNDGKTIEEAIKEIENGNFFKAEKMKTADYLASLNLNKGETYAIHHTIKKIK